MDAQQLAALDDLILGRGVKRGRHELAPEVIPLFRERLAALGFEETTVGAVEIEIGTRVPSWVVRGNVADFGMIFWEIFTEKKRRKLFASTVRNAKGDWDIQLNPQSTEPVYANRSLAESYDASRPVGIW